MSLVEVDHPTRWKRARLQRNPSGLPGKPVGARTAFSQGAGFVWEPAGSNYSDRFAQFVSSCHGRSRSKAAAAASTSASA